jgi:beta-glucosidase
LTAFEAAVREAGVGSVMASYNEINGIPVHANRWLLDEVLRREWGFRGFIVSDGNGITQLEMLHHVAGSRVEAARKALETGIDFELDRCFHTLIDQVLAGIVPEAAIDRAASRILTAKFLLGLFEDPFVDPDQADRLTNTSESRRLALQAAHKSLVLLKNDGQLPLELGRIKTLAVIGPNAAGVHLGGYSADPGRAVGILDGIRLKVGDRLKVTYAQGCRITVDDFGGRGWRGWHEDPAVLPDPAEERKLIAEAVKVASKAEVALLVIGENESVCREAWSASHLGDRDTLDLPGLQNELVEAVIGTGVPTVVLLLNGRPLSINYAAEHANAVLEGWYLGQEGGTAFADVLFGDVNPGGRLPITFPRSVGQLPAYYNHKPSARRGYLFTDKAPLFPFGHGLSYTTFRYENLRLEPAKVPVDGKAAVCVEVTNTGQRAGDEVVQLYIRDLVTNLVTRPVKELKGFRRITLQPGETQTVRFEVGPAQLAFWNEEMKRVVEPGEFEIMVGGSSAELSVVKLDVG